MTKYFAVASRGTERVLAEELKSVGVTPVEARRGGVAFGTRLDHAYLVCMWSRVASRVLFPLSSFEATDADGLYNGVGAIDWTTHLGPDVTFAVDVAGKNAPSGPGHFIALKTKDAIVDRIRAAEGVRPSVDTHTPDLRVNIHVRGPQVTVSIDLSGRGLHRRGMDRSGAEAPIKENLAAAILRLAGWPPPDVSRPFVDPMCGSGTFLIEATSMALDIAPGLNRTLGPRGWRGHDRSLWNKLQTDAAARAERATTRTIRVFGSDVSDTALSIAARSLRRARLGSRVSLRQQSLKDVVPPGSDPGVLVTNPPYGARLGDDTELIPLYELLGDVLKHRYAGWHAWVFTGNLALGKRIGLRAASRQVLYNGPIESRLLEFPISAAPTRGTGPGWRRPSRESKALVTRLRKNLTRLRPWAERHALTCYRIYDADVPEYNLAVDWYDGAVRVEEYGRPRKVPPADADRRLRDALLVVQEMLDLDPDAVVLRVRRRRGPGEPHQRPADRHRVRHVRERDLRFEVNLEDYLDTGLFLDDRCLRQLVQERSLGAHFLNLFSYTCTASVAAAFGGARSTTNVDLSNTSLDWGRRNFALNDLPLQPHRFVRADVSQWLSGEGPNRYDLVFLAPPMHSRSKAMQSDLDVQRDHVDLIQRVGTRLAPTGYILFATNLKGFALDHSGLRGWRALDITEQVTPFDFARRPRLRAWTLSPANIPAP
ncbi:MAG: bifunctional 23S rRNA (guanine(2069)-N(7))-methyltransferase RlmK/23S rRNA (guanine(2445)-N(2))-methyltransferase RlmL [Acidobacteriota bacterium]|nr:bifunctional 23S rRNA (guanine(2069)-N(7))-methyltransferase RlmK/23S rRNA (guanine(2445)-N(2))-methyltransferase RlmL [Acidobacteriota bacterium]